jgi:long-chain fatty acid transport protein
MTNKTFKSLLAVSAASLAIVGSAQAGGFARGDADTAIIYEEGNFNMRSGVTIVSPTRKYTQVTSNPSLVGHDYAETYVVPSFAFKGNVTDDLRCAATLVNNNGGDSSKPAGTGLFGQGTTTEEFVTYEYGATCGYKFDLSKGRFWIIGGLFAETFDYSRQQNVASHPVLGTLVAGDLKLDGKDYGYRVGAAYEITEIALRAELMYRSGTKYGAPGTLTLSGPLAPITTPQAALGSGELPQSVEFNLQSGIAPGWLAFTSVKWTDWSVTDVLNVSAPTLGVNTDDTFYWRDGWTVTGGVGHAFNDKISGLAAITWDRGVGTGYDLSGDTWTFSVGGSVKDAIGGELRGGVGLSRLGSAQDFKDGAGTAVGTDWALAGSIGYAIKW